MKKTFVLFIVLSIFSCTAAVVECELLGKWEGESGGITYVIEFFTDDTFVYSWDNGNESLCETYKITSSPSLREDVILYVSQRLSFPLSHE